MDLGIAGRHAVLMASSRGLGRACAESLAGYHALDECSVVTAPYHADGELIGMIGVIGPTRMAYERVIPIVDITAKILGNSLK